MLESTECARLKSYIETFQKSLNELTQPGFQASWQRKEEYLYEEEWRSHNLFKAQQEYKDKCVKNKDSVSTNSEKK